MLMETKFYRFFASDDIFKSVLFKTIKKCFFAFRRAEETSIENSFSTQKTVATFQSQAFTWKKLKKSSSEI